MSFLRQCERVSNRLSEIHGKPDGFYDKFAAAQMLLLPVNEMMVHDVVGVLNDLLSLTKYWVK